MHRYLWVAGWLLLAKGGLGNEGNLSPVPPKPTRHEVREVCGWRVRIDERLNVTTNEVAARAVQLLEGRLAVVAALMKAAPLKNLREVTIQIDLTHGKLRAMQYHPSRAWLRENGYDTNLAKCVHIPDATYFASSYEVFRQPMAVLHELAHAYHDQVLGFDEARVKSAWQAFKESGRYDKVLMNTADTRRHYALTNEREFFAEMTESYYGCNDFFPFVAGELEREEPAIFKLMKEIWGPLPRRSE